MYSKSSKYIIRTLCVLILSVAANLIPQEAKSQVVWQDSDSQIYHFLQRQANLGRIEFDDLILPVPRKEIAAHLKTLREGSFNMSPAEAKDLEFYSAEFSEFEPALDTLTLFKKDQHGVWRSLAVKDKDFMLRAEPVFNAGIVTKGNSSVFEWGNGLKFWGHAGQRFAFQAYFEDITETGDNLDRQRIFTPREGIVRTVTLNSNSINYSRFRGNLTYAFKNGTVSAGNDQLQWGYGENGKVVLSDKVPAYPMIRLDYKPLTWLRFNYMHAWLHSDLLDSARTYPKGNDVYGDNRELYIQKYLATHSLTFLPTKGLTVSVGESMVYSDRLNAAYLIPIMFFKAFDQHESKYNVPRGSNGQFFLQASSRNNLIRGSHVYGTIFIDEIRMSKIFDPEKNRNQVGFNIGASMTDLLIPYLTAGAEYTRLNPFAYQNIIPAQTYQHQSYNLGDWIGQNADRVTAFVKYNPISRLSTHIRLDYIRKGEDGDINDQYFAEPQPKFLTGSKEIQKQLFIEARYQLLQHLNVRASFYKQGGAIMPALQTAYVPHEFRFGISYGLN